jgi:hypothetical protein
MIEFHQTKIYQRSGVKTPYMCTYCIHTRILKKYMHAVRAHLYINTHMQSYMCAFVFAVSRLSRRHQKMCQKHAPSRFLLHPPQACVPANNPASRHRAWESLSGAPPLTYVLNFRDTSRKALPTKVNCSKNAKQDAVCGIHSSAGVSARLPSPWQQASHSR